MVLSVLDVCVMMVVRCGLCVLMWEYFVWCVCEVMMMGDCVCVKSDV